MSSMNSACSSWRTSVASATDLSRLSMPATRALISPAMVAIDSSKSAIVVSRPLIERSRPFFLSSDKSNWASQYSFLWSSSSCSAPRSLIMSSIILTTFSKVAFLPWSARAMKSNSGRAFPAWCLAFAISAKARFFCEAVFTFSCTKELAPGSVFLKSSSASSSERTLIVSANATCSSARIFMFASFSSVLVAQFVSKSFRNFVSSIRAFCVSLKSSFICTISTPSSPTRTVLVSIALVSASTSFVLAAMSSS
mmetsp:Transcript_52934/g.97708  ORF Transcript_52934/g.97708 Transcript_52934/m.97708 type:complete len:253 (-) Transcript_52934:772-1530(-)